MQNLLELNQPALAQFFAQLGEKPASVKMRAKQTLKWLHQSQVTDFSAMTDIAKATRELLAANAEIRDLNVIRDSTASDGTRKWLFDVGTSAVDAVFIPEDDRGTLCISSQAGCALDCSFCSTGKQGFNRNLSAAEIIGQLWLANKLLGAARADAEEHATDLEAGEKDNGRIISNVVMMGMGEPLANFDNVVTALRLMLDDHAYGLSRRRVTVSTSGIVPAMDRLAEACPVALAVSLHAPTDGLRDRLVPINRKYPLADLMAACQRYLKTRPRASVTFEYTLMKGINDAPEHARALVKLLRRMPSKLNLIPFNPFPGTRYERSDEDAIRRFQTIVMEAGLIATVRRTRGDDIDAACGQLVGNVLDRTRRSSLHKSTLAAEVRA